MIEIRHRDTQKLLHTVRGDTLRGACLGGRKLAGAEFGAADLQGVHLDSADLRGANLAGAVLPGADFSRSNLEGASMMGARGYRGTAGPGLWVWYVGLLIVLNMGWLELVAEDPHFWPAVLLVALLVLPVTGFSLFQALPEAFRTWRLGATMNLGGASLQGADLTRADLRQADLRDADLRSTDLTGAKLNGADLRGADLRQAALVQADLGFADLRGSDLRGADLRAQLFGVKLEGARYDETTRWLGSFRPPRQKGETAAEVVPAPVARGRGDEPSALGSPPQGPKDVRIRRSEAFPGLSDR